MLGPRLWNRLTRKVTLFDPRNNTIGSSTRI
jgi:hypothetical protein